MRKRRQKEIWCLAQGSLRTGKNPSFWLSDKALPAPSHILISSTLRVWGRGSPGFGGVTFTGARAPQRWTSDNNCPSGRCFLLVFELGVGPSIWSGPGWLKCCIMAKGNTGRTEPWRIWAAWVASPGKSWERKAKLSSALCNCTGSKATRCTAELSVHCAVTGIGPFSGLAWVSFLLTAKPPSLVRQHPLLATTI